MAAFPLVRRLFVFAILLLPGTLPLLAQQTAASFAYDVVSIKPSKADGGSTSITVDDGLYSATNVRLKELMRYAFGLTTPDQLSGLSGWADSARYDVVAKMDPETVTALKALPDKESTAAQQAMMQKVLADRFQLKVRHEIRDLPVYTLSIAKSGSRLTPDVESRDSDQDAEKRGGNMSVSNGEMSAQHIPVSSLAEFLAQQVHRKVLDGTGLKGNFDFALKWTRDDLVGEPQEGQAPSLFTALQEQLGLRLDSGRGPVDTIVIEHIEMPSEN